MAVYAATPEPGGRYGLHGMVLYGSNPYFLSHIPMFHEPHDQQLIMRVSLTTQNGHHVSENFTKETYSIRPLRNFSLNDLILGRLQTFQGDIYEGNFESNGKVVFANVFIKVEKKLFNKKIPFNRSLPGFTYFLVGDGHQLFAINEISRTNPYQQIVSFETDAQIGRAHV